MNDRSRTIALMLESDGPGGAEIFLLNSALELRRRGYRVVPVLPSDDTGWLIERFVQNDFDYHTFTHRKALDLRCFRDMVNDLTREGVDVVHSHEFFMAVYGAAACRLKGLRQVVTLHGNQWIMESRRNRMALKWACRSSGAVVAVSEDTRSHFTKSMGLPLESMTTIPNGIPDPDGDPAGPREEFGLRPDEVVLVAVGNMTERKGHIVLLRALARIESEGCDVPWRLIIAGDGDQRPALEAFLAESGLESRVHLPGHRSDIGDLQAAAHVMVMPSLWEGLPLAVLEGMYSGNPVIGSRTSGIPEAVREGVDGLLVTAGDDEDLSRAVRRLLENPEERQAMGESARERARAKFSIERMMDDYEALYWPDEHRSPST